MPVYRPTPWMRCTAKSPVSSSSAIESVRRRVNRGAVRVCRRAPNRSSSVTTARRPAWNRNPSASGDSTGSTGTSSPSTSRARSREPWPRADSTMRNPAPASSRAREASSAALPCPVPQLAMPRSSPSANSVRCSRTRSPIASSSVCSTLAAGQAVASASASPSRCAARARSRVRCAWVSTTHPPSGTSSAGVGMRSNRNGASDSAPSTNNPSAMRASWSAKRSGASAAAARARSRRASSGTSSRVAGTSASATRSVDSCVEGTNSLIDSTSSPK